MIQTQNMQSCASKIDLLKCWMMALVARPYNDLGDEPIPSILKSNASHFSI